MCYYERNTHEQEKTHDRDCRPFPVFIHLERRVVILRANLGEEMSNTYERVKQEKIRRMEEYRAAGEDPGFFTMNLVYEDGPQWQVGWCVPLLPGILLVDSAASCGPLSGGGHRQFVFFYGYGTTVLCNRDTWRQ